MKYFAMIGCLVLGILLLNVSGNAQVSRQYAVHVPFDFSVGSKLLKAGDYTLGPASGVTNQRAILLRSNFSGKTEIVVGQAGIGVVDEDVKGTLTFVKDSDVWALQIINAPSFTLKLRKTGTAERNLATAKSTVDLQK